MTLHTAHYTSRDPDRLDITRAGCDRLIAADKPAPGEILAPSARLVFPALRRMKAAKSDAERDAVFAVYSRDYCDERRQAFARWPYKVDAILRRSRVVFVCFCADPARCHRTLAAGLLAVLGADNRGEIATTAATPHPQRTNRNR